MKSTLPTYNSVSCDQANILPSYQMHDSVIGRRSQFRTSIDEILPTYEIDDNFSEITSIYTSSSSMYTNQTSFSYLDDEMSSSKLLEVHRKLRNLQDSNNISIDLNFTSENTIGEKPSIININDKEYCLGDMITGFVIIKNKKTEPIPFISFYIVFEGNFVKYSPFTKHNSKNNFLQMVDIAASSHITNINNLPEYDQYDSTKLQFEHDGFLLPNTTYKKYFSFQIPNKLLDNGETNVPYHQELPPTTTINDLNRFGGFFQYSVDAKLIGLDSHQTSYEILCEIETPIKIMPKATEKLLDEEKFHEAEIKYNFDNLVRGIKNHLNHDNYSKNQFNSDKLNNTHSSTPSKAQYSGNNQIVLPYRKNSYLGGTKIIGYIMTGIPNKSLKLNYIPPTQGRNELLIQNWKKNIQINFLYSRLNQNSSLPKIQNIEAKLIQYHVTSPENKIPIELNHEMLFNNKTGETFKSLIKEKFKKLLKEVDNKVVLVTDRENLKDDIFIKDGKLLTSLSCHEVSLDIHSDMNSLSWQEKGHIMNGEIDLLLDFSKIKLNSGSQLSENDYTFGQFNLTPSFQNNYMSRMYCVEVSIEFNQTSTVKLRLPVSIEN